LTVISIPKKRYQLNATIAAGAPNRLKWDTSGQRLERMQSGKEEIAWRAVLGTVFQKKVPDFKRIPKRFASVIRC
jgi:hypothetical protein